MSLNLDVPPVTAPEALDVLVQYYAGTLTTHTALARLVAQQVTWPDAWLAVGRAHNIRTDVHAAGIVGASLGEGACLTTTVLDWWLAAIHNTELETHIARGLWLINWLAPALSTRDVRELKARYLIHDLGKLGPLGLTREAVHLVLHSFELRRIALQQPVATVFAEHFGSAGPQLLAMLTRYTPQAHLEVHTPMRKYFDHHEAWGGQRLATLAAAGHVAESVASQAHLHHHPDRSYAPYGLITYLDMYEASTGRMSYDPVTGHETRLAHGEALAAIWHRFTHVDHPKLTPELAAAYIRLLTLLDRWMPHLPGCSPHGRVPGACG